jgi:Ca2+-binding RTX toxin-like protein
MTRVETIAVLYLSIFGKDPTSEQLDEYASFSDNIPLETIASTMTSSSAALQLPSETQALVKAVFQTLFNYSSSQMDTIIAEQAQNALNGGIDGFQYWVDQVDNNPFITKETIVIAIINGTDEQGLDDIASMVSSVISSYETWLSENDTIQGATITGTVMDDFLNGSDTDNYIYGLDGNDTILTYGGDNMVEAGDGDDTIYADTGKDTIYGNNGSDTIYASDGDDKLYGGDGDDYIHGEAGNDTIEGGVGNDYLYGEDGDDFIDGNSGNDVINAGAGDNILYGGTGNDTIYLGIGTNFVDGGSGNDLIYGNDGIDEIYGGAGDDTIYSYAEADTIDGLSGNDTIYGGLGDDVINGNEDDDNLYGGDGDDIIYGESGLDLLVGGKGADTLIGGSGQDTFLFSQQDSTSSAIDTIVDFSSSEDIIKIIDKGTEQFYSKLDVSSALTLNQAINMAASGDGSTNGIIKWFQFEEFTYVVEDLSSDTIFSDTTDIVIKLQGIVDITFSNLDFQ